MPLLTRRRQIAARIKSNPEGSAFETATLAAANARLTVYDPTIVYEVQQSERNPARATLGSVASIPGTRLARITFAMDLEGSGTAGVAPQYGKLLRACGMSETINTGVASIGTAVKNTLLSTGTGADPTMGGTFTGTASGTLYMTIQSIVTNTSITINATFYPGDGSTPLSADFTQSAAAAVALTGVAPGVTFDFGDPSVSTAGYAVGDQWTVQLVSSSQVDVVYEPISDSIPLLDFGIYQDGRLHRVSNARGNVRFAMNIGEPSRMEFEFMGVPDTASSDVVDAALLTGIAYPDVVPLPFIQIAATLFSATPECYTNLEIDLGNTLAARQCSEAETGHSSVRITDRNVTGTINPEAALVATADIFGRLFAGTTGNLLATIGSASGNIVEFEATRVQITNVADDDRDGIAVDTLDLRFNEPEFDGGGIYREIKLTVK